MPIFSRARRGFTLVELVIVITITGIIAAVVAVFIQAPVKGYIDAARRADATDVADTALRRMSRDLHLALPNSVRLIGTTSIEFLQTRAGGRYRAETGSTTADDILDFTQNDTSFELLGPPITFTTNDQIVIYNLGIDGASAYTGGTTSAHNRRTYNGTIGSTTLVQFASVGPFPFDSPSHSFQVVDTPVSYVCDLAAGTLTRHWGYPIPVTQVSPPVGAGLQSGLLAKNVTGCVFTYTPGVTERNGLVTLQLSIGQSSESVTLYHEVHVSNVP